MSAMQGVMSTDTLFIRGFSSRQRVEDIRSFFSREGGRNTIEFFRETNDGGLFVALKFESKSVAKSVLSRFDDNEVLGDRIKVAWYRDMRKSYGGYNDFRRGQQWPSDRSYDYRGGRGGGSQYRGRGGVGPYFNGPRQWQPRSGLGSGNRDYGSDRPQRRRLATRSTSRSHSRSVSPGSRSPRSRTRSSSNESRSKSTSSRDRSRKARRSSSDGSNRNRSSRKVKSKSEHEGTKRSVSATDSSHSDEDASPPPQTRKKDKKKKKKSRSSPNDRIQSAERSPREELAGSNDSNASASDNETPVTQSNAALFAADDSLKSSLRTALRSTVQAAPPVKKTVGSKAPVDPDSPERSSDGEPTRKMSADTHSSPKTTLPQWKKLRNEQQHEDIFSERDLAQADKSRKAQPEHAQPNEDILTADLSNHNQRTAYSPSEVDNELSFEDHRFKMPGAVPPSVAAKKRKSLEDSKRQSEDDLSKRQRVATPETLFDAKFAGISSALAPSGSKKKQVLTESGVSLPPEKMTLVHEKKAEIEKAYKQDCETFATVTKMLISKDPGIEDRIQMSLRENLKEIGQRCIQELRDFIERLKTEQQEDVV